MLQQQQGASFSSSRTAYLSRALPVPDAPADLEFLFHFSSSYQNPVDGVEADLVGLCSVEAIPHRDRGAFKRARQSLRAAVHGA